MAKFRNALFVRGPSVHPKVVRKKIKLVLQRSLSLSLSTRKGWRLIVRRCFVLFFRWPRNIRFFLISFVEKNSSSVRCVLIKNTGVSFRSWKYFFASHCLLTAHGSVTEKGGGRGEPRRRDKIVKRREVEVNACTRPALVFSARTGSLFPRVGSFVRPWRGVYTCTNGKIDKVHAAYLGRGWFVPIFYGDSCVT